MESNNFDLTQFADPASRIALIGDLQSPTLQIVGSFDWRLAGEARNILAIRRLTAIDCTAMHEMDTIGALVLLRLCNEIKPQPRLVGLSENQRHFLEEISHATLTPEPIVQVSRWLQRVEAVGNWVTDLKAEAAGFSEFCGQIVLAATRTLRLPRRLRFTSILHHMHETGFKSLPLIGLLSALLGVVLVSQSPAAVPALGIVVAALIVASRSGTAFAAQIGSMEANEEIDAMRTIGMDPIDFLVLPRVIALIVILPLLALFADSIAIASGAIMANIKFGTSLPQFISQFQAANSLQQFWLGELKAPLFGLLIALIGCFQGLRVIGGAEGVGKSTTAAAVQSVFAIIFVDTLCSIFYPS